MSFFGFMVVVVLIYVGIHFYEKKKDEEEGNPWKVLFESLEDWDEKIKDLEESGDKEVIKAIKDAEIKAEQEMCTR